MSEIAPNETIHFMADHRGHRLGSWLTSLMNHSPACSSTCALSDPAPYADFVCADLSFRKVAGADIAEVVQSGGVASDREGSTLA